MSAINSICRTDSVHPKRQAVRPHYSEPGTLRQQLEAIAFYVTDPTRVYWPEAAWQTARAFCIPHARRFDT